MFVGVVFLYATCLMLVDSAAVLASSQAPLVATSLEDLSNEFTSSAKPHTGNNETDITTTTTERSTSVSTTEGFSTSVSSLVSTDIVATSDASSEISTKQPQVIVDESSNKNVDKVDGNSESTTTVLIEVGSSTTVSSVLVSIDAVSQTPHVVAATNGDNTVYASSSSPLTTVIDDLSINVSTIPPDIKWTSESVVVTSPAVLRADNVTVPEQLYSTTVQSIISNDTVILNATNGPDASITPTSLSTSEFSSSTTITTTVLDVTSGAGVVSSVASNVDDTVLETFSTTKAPETTSSSRNSTAESSFNYSTRVVVGDFVTSSTSSISHDVNHVENNKILPNCSSTKPPIQPTHEFRLYFSVAEDFTWDKVDQLERLLRYYMGDRTCSGFARTGFSLGPPHVLSWTNVSIAFCREVGDQWQHMADIDTEHPRHAMIEAFSPHFHVLRVERKLLNICSGTRELLISHVIILTIIVVLSAGFLSCIITIFWRLLHASPQKHQQIPLSVNGGLTSVALTPCGDGSVPVDAGLHRRKPVLLPGERASLVRQMSRGGDDGHGAGTPSRGGISSSVPKPVAPFVVDTDFCYINPNFLEVAKPSPKMRPPSYRKAAPADRRVQSLELIPSRSQQQNGSALGHIANFSTTSKVPTTTTSPSSSGVDSGGSSSNGAVANVAAPPPVVPPHNHHSKHHSKHHHKNQQLTTAETEA